MMIILWAAAFAHSGTPTKLTVLANVRRCGLDQTLRLADQQYIKDDKYKFTDENGNCRCPPSHLCYTTHQLKDLTGIQRDGVAGSTDVEEELQEVKEQMSLIIGCPVMGTEHLNWKTSRTSYNWQAKSAVCRAMSSPTMRSATPPVRLLLMGLLALGIVLIAVVNSRYRRDVGQQQFLSHPVPSHLGTPPPTDRHLPSRPSTSYAQLGATPRSNARFRTDSEPPPFSRRSRSPPAISSKGLGGWKQKQNV